MDIVLALPSGVRRKHVYVDAVPAYDAAPCVCLPLHTHTHCMAGLRLLLLRDADKRGEALQAAGSMGARRGGAVGGAHFGQPAGLQRDQVPVPPSARTCPRPPRETVRKSA
jgi:hypothetical protein